MSAMTHGMDVGQVRQLAQQMRASADEIQGIISKLTGMLQGTPWLGADRTQFEGEWNGQYVAQLKQVAEALQQAAQKADQQASQQEQASGS